MKSESSEEIKKEIRQLSPKKLAELIMRLARFKKENKELLSYLLFFSENPQGYTDSLKLEMEEEFIDLPKASVYFTKKALRKVLRNISRQNRYMATKIANAELLVHFCKLCMNKNLVSRKQPVLLKIYEQQLEKIEKLIPELEEDLQFDFRREVEKLKIKN